MFLLVKDESKATSHAMPDEVSGFTDILDNNLRQILYGAHHEREIFAITYDPSSKVFESMKNTNSQLEISCHPLEGMFDFDQRPGTGKSELSKDINKLIEGGPESLEDREKWQLLTRELAQKQEIIH